MKHIKKYAVYGDVYASDGMYIPEWFYRGNFYRCEIFIANHGDYHYDYEEVVGAWSIGWSEEYLEERWDAIPDEDEFAEQKMDALMDEELTDLKKQQDKFNAKYRPDLKKKLERNTVKNCIDCSEVLTLGGNWTEARKSQSKYLCKTCWTIRDSLRMHVNSIEVSQSHPLYKAGRYRGFEEAAFSSLENYKTNPEGEVYIIFNPAWDGWVKVGMAVDATDRLKNYQTSSPLRDYKLLYVFKTDSRRELEADVHSRLSDIFERKNEWFKCSPEIAKRFVEAALGDQHEAA